MIGRTLHLAAALLGGALGAQLPAVYARYTHELGARIRQARDGLESVTAYARDHGIPVHEALTRLRAKGGVAEAAYADLAETHRTLARLEPAHAALTGADPLTRPIAFVRHLDPHILETALASFTPGIPLSTAGAAYAFAGACLVLLMWRAAHTLARWAARAVRAHRTVSPKE